MVADDSQSVNAQSQCRCKLVHATGWHKPGGTRERPRKPPYGIEREPNSLGTDVDCIGGKSRNN